MNVLDENIDEPQRLQLESWGLHVRQIGVELGTLGMKDLDAIIPLLHSLRRPTFFTRDGDFYHPWLRHRGYCLIYLNVAPGLTANYLRRCLRHPAFRTQAQRMGKVIRVHETGVTYWQAGMSRSQKLDW